MRILDLFCGAGGASRGYSDAGFTVVGADLNPQGNYPYQFIQIDAIDLLWDMVWNPHFYVNIDAIHASPPCQKFSTMTHVSGDRDREVDLIGRVRELCKISGLPYIIENVPGAPLENPVRLCGSSFGLPIRRHRMFETNWPLHGLPCNHKSQEKKYRVYDHGKWYLSSVLPIYGNGGGKGKEYWNEAMGIDWMNREEIVQSIPPKYTEYIGGELMRYLNV